MTSAPIQQTYAELPPTPSPIDLAEAVQRRWAARAAVDPTVQCLLMVDPTLRDASDAPSYRACLERWAQASSVQSPEDLATPIHWTHPNLKPEHRPRLIALALDRYASADLLQASIALALEDQELESLMRGDGNRVCGWLLTSAPVKQLAVHLGALAVQQLPGDFPAHPNKRMLLRYFDPSVMPSLWQLSTDAQRLALLGPIDEWLMLGRTGELVSYVRPANAANDTSSTAASGLIGYSTAQWMALDSIGALNQVAMRLQAGVLGGAAPTSEQIDVATRALARARGAAISDARDLQEFAWHALTVDAHFDRHPLIVRSLRDVANGTHDFYTAAIAHLREDDWVRIRMDLNGRESSS